MFFSEAWLRELVNPAISTEELVDQLTMLGLEVDSVKPAAADFSLIVVGEVIEIWPHPNADKLRICRVAIGQAEPLQIVCGADNVRVGLKAPVALVGAVLPGNFKIKKSKLRGEQSLGMLCSEKELGLAAEADGLMELFNDAPVGTDIREYLSLNDIIIEVDLTPNRADCLSLEGVAREVAVLNRIDWTAPEIQHNEITHRETFPVFVDNTKSCPRYLGRLIKNVNPAAETPLWMQEKLRRSGLRSLGPLVDVTNYVLLEMGQPLHAFDADKLTSAITVRMGREDEQLVLLNDQAITLNSGSLVIADAEKALALAGIMGGSETAVSDDTSHVFLECAFFSPEMMMGKARHFGLHTDSSHRFERGVDPYIQSRAIERATRLIIEICGGNAGPITEAVDMEMLPDRQPVLLRKKRIERLLGIEIPNDRITEILQRLGMDVQSVENGWQVCPPGFRFDIAIEADLIEEIGRVYGYNNLPQSSLLMRSELGEANETILELDRVKDLLVDRDYQEAITYSFVDEKIQSLIAPGDQFVSLQNPISAELSVMRTTLLGGLLLAAQRNTNRQQHRVRLFESGMCFIRKEDELCQKKMLAGILLGNVYTEQWSEQERNVDFFDIKADVEALLSLTGLKLQYIPLKDAALHPGQAAEIVSDEGIVLGRMGMLHPTLEKQLGIDTPVFLFELDQELTFHRKVPAFKTLSRFPSVRRDLAIIVEETITAKEITDCIESCNESLVQDLIFFDVYRGKGVEQGYKSIAFGLVIQDYEQTLKDSEIDAIVDRVLTKMKNELRAKLRD